MRVFISSVITGMEDLRAAAREAIETVDAEPVAVEDFPASTATPRSECLRAVREAGAVVVILGAKYGALQASGRSATHDEFEEAAQTARPIFVFVQQDVEREPRQLEFLRRAENWDGGHFRSAFRTPAELRKEVGRALSRWKDAQARGLPDEDELRKRAEALVPSSGQASLVVAVAFGPTLHALRPAELEEPELRRDLEKNARFGPNAVFDEHGETELIRGPALTLRQPRLGRGLTVDELGSIAITRPLPRRGRTMCIVEEDLLAEIERALRFAGDAADRIDAVGRLTHCVPVASVLGASFMGWKTEAEFREEPDRFTIPPSAGDRHVEVLRPALQTRGALRGDAPRMARDLTTLLRSSRLGHGRDSRPG